MPDGEMNTLSAFLIFFVLMQRARVHRLSGVHVLSEVEVSVEQI